MKIPIPLAGAVLTSAAFFAGVVTAKKTEPYRIVVAEREALKQGRKEGYQHALDTLSQTNVFQGPLVVPESGTVTNCIFITISKPAPIYGLIIEGGTNTFVGGCTFYGGGGMEVKFFEGDFE